MEYFEFTTEEKAAYFDELAKRYYNKNFATLSKTDADLLMFHFYLKKFISQNTDEDGIINFQMCSDFKISKELGITQRRVKGLKEKSQLVYPIELQWQKNLRPLLKNARRDNDKIVIPISDPSLLREAENYIEELGGYTETCVKDKCLIIRPEYYIDLQMEIFDENDRNAVIKELRKELEKSGKANNELDEEHIGKTLIKGGINIATFIAQICASVTPESALFKAFELLLKVFQSN